MAQYFAIHPTHPQKRLIRRAADILRTGGLIAYPTDSCYALGCLLDDAEALERLRRLRGIDAKHHLTLMCRDHSEIATYAIVDDARFRLLKAALHGGSYTFILKARRQVPRRVTHARRKTIGVRGARHPAAPHLLPRIHTHTPLPYHYPSYRSGPPFSNPEITSNAYRPINPLIPAR